MKEKEKKEMIEKITKQFGMSEEQFKNMIERASDEQVIEHLLSKEPNRQGTIEKVFEEYHKRKIQNLFANKDFIIANEEERKKLSDQFNNDFVNFVNSFKNKQPEAISKFRVELLGLYSRFNTITKEAEIFVSTVYDLVQERNFEKIRFLIFKFKRELINHIRSNNHLQDASQINYDDFYRIINIIKDTYKIDYFWTRIKR